MEFFEIKFDEDFIGARRTDDPPVTTAWAPGEDEIECSLRPFNPKPTSLQQQVNFKGAATTIRFKR